MFALTCKVMLCCRTVMFLLRKSEVMCSTHARGTSLAVGEHHARSAHHVPRSGTHRSKKSLLSVDKRDFFVGGGEESRTPVRKSIPIVFYECIFSFTFPGCDDEKQSSHPSSFLVHDRLKSKRTMHVHHCLTPKREPWYSRAGRAALRQL